MDPKMLMPMSPSNRITIMVRIKERYLLVNILYPSELGSRPHLPDVVLLNQPTTPDLSPQLLRRAITAQVAALFGDYGSGALEGGNLQGKPTYIPRLYPPLPTHTHANPHH
ncbi:hypothetical protein GGR57DRAFT_497068 [Xylariaceae sp. FL1272]|nr:hypothetical protein GGR57DRAFT_497068 [Xylariaceae sp. FL1272]